MGVPRPSSTETDPPAPSPGDKRPLADRAALQLELRAPHVDVDELSTADGLYAIISQRRSSGIFTFAIYRTFQRRTGDVERTAFVPESQGKSYLELAKLVLERIAKIRASGTAPFPERER